MSQTLLLLRKLAGYVGKRWLDIIANGMLAKVPTCPHRNKIYVRLKTGRSDYKNFGQRTWTLGALVFERALLLANHNSVTSHLITNVIMMKYSSQSSPLFKKNYFTEDNSVRK